MTPQRRVVAIALLLLTTVGSNDRLTAITGGAPIPATELAPGGHFEWLVRLDGPEGRCSGSLIAEEWILTAGHCRTSTTAFIGDDTAGVAIVEVVTHPSIGSGQIQTDAALLRLATPSAIRPVSRASLTLTIKAGDDITLAGWGLTSASGSDPTQPSSGTAKVTGVTNDVIATGPPAGGCSGDSGGAMLVRGTFVGVITSADANCNASTSGPRFSGLSSFVTSVAGAGSTNRRPVVLSGEVSAAAGGTADIPIEFSDPETPMSFDDVVDIDPGPLDLIGCDGDVPTICHFGVPEGFSGDAVFTYAVSDGQRRTDAQWTVHVFVLPEPPIAQDDAVIVSPGVARDITLNAFDPNGDALTFTIVTPPSHGALSNCASGTCSYTAQAAYAGPDSFTWRASDGVFNSNIATMAIEVRPPQAPTVTAGAAVAVLDNPVELTLDAVDPNGDVITFTIVTPPQHGTLTDCSTGTCSYVAQAGFLGTDAFTWRASDGVLTSALATFSIEVLPHQRPTADDQTAIIKSNTATSIELSAFDPDGADLTVALITPPQHGTLTCDLLACQYRPQSNFAGTDSFIWRVSDGELLSRIATFTFEIHSSSWRVTPLDVAGDAHAMAAAIAGPGATVSNATFIGAAAAAGTFAGAADAIGLSSGVILSSGRVADAIGPNLGTPSTKHQLPGDDDVPSPSFDASVLRFNLIPSSSTFTVRYVFGSEEYSGGVGVVDDGMAIMVNGENCALVNGAPVSIGSIDHGNDELGVDPSNPELLIANEAGEVDTEMNGLTVVLTCTAPVIPGQPNDIKIVVADNFDGTGDSAVLIEGTLAVNTAPTLTALPDITKVAAGPTGAVVTFVASGNDAEDGVLPATCSPASGATFAIGETTVTCTVTDQVGATATDAFTVTITEPETPGHMTGDGHLRDDGTRYEFSFNARENDRGEKATFSLRINNDGKGKKNRDDRFESRKVTFIAFSDDPNVRHKPRRPQIDTVLFSGTGEWNGKNGFRYEVFAQDEAEAGRRHRESIRVTVWSAAGAVVASFDGEVSGGTIRSKRIKH